MFSNHKVVAGLLHIYGTIKNNQLKLTYLDKIRGVQIYLSDACKAGSLYPFPTNLVGLVRSNAETCMLYRINSAWHADCMN